MWLTCTEPVKGVYRSTWQSKFAESWSKRDERQTLMPKIADEPRVVLSRYVVSYALREPLSRPLPSPPRGFRLANPTRSRPYSFFFPPLSYKIPTRELDKVEGHPAIIAGQSNAGEEDCYEEQTYMRGRRCQSHFLLILAFISSVISPSQPATKAAASSTS